jgi:fibronectin type 3 domain-containing protein
VSGFSNTVEAGTKSLPAMVTGLSVVDPINRAIAWQPNKEKDVHSYTVYKKGFMDGRQKMATVQGTRWEVSERQDSLELFVTAIDDSGLESEPSDMVVFKKSQ